MKILVLVDRLHWAYYSIFKNLEKFNQYELINMDCMPIKGNVKNIKKCFKKYDRFLVMGYQTYDKVDFLPKNNTLVGVHSHHSWDDKRTAPDVNVDPTKKLVDTLNSFKSVNVVSGRLFDIFTKAGIDSLYYTPNGVDSGIFKPVKKKSSGGFYIGFSGSV